MNVYNGDGNVSMESRLLFQFYAQGTERTAHIFRRPRRHRCRFFIFCWYIMYLGYT